MKYIATGVSMTPEEKELFEKYARELRQSVSGFIVKSALERIERLEAMKKENPTQY